MSTKLSITVGVFPPGSSAKFATRTIVYTDLAGAFDTFSSMIVNPPLSAYIPEPPAPQEEPNV